MLWHGLKVELGAVGKKERLPRDLLSISRIRTHPGNVHFAFQMHGSTARRTENASPPSAYFSVSNGGHRFEPNFLVAGKAKTMRKGTAGAGNCTAKVCRSVGPCHDLRCWCHLESDPLRNTCHSREGRNPVRRRRISKGLRSRFPVEFTPWIPAFAGMTRGGNDCTWQRPFLANDTTTRPTLNLTLRLPSFRLACEAARAKNPCWTWLLSAKI